MRALPHCTTAFLTAVAACAAMAQPTAPAAQADAPTTPPRYHAPPPLAGVEQGSTGWRAAHEAVAAFPRGHADIVAWEARQAASAPQPSGPPAPAGHDHHHGGHQP